MVALVGVGLANAFIALKFSRENPSVRLVLIDTGERTEKTWSFHVSDVENDPWILDQPWVHQWHGYAVKFPGLERAFQSGYASIASHKFWPAFEQTMRAHGVEWIKGRAALVENNRVVMEDGRIVEAECVLDGRGFQASVAKHGTRFGYQKFVGWDVELEHPHGLAAPRLMDATVAQHDGFRFVYLLPWDSKRLLIEDTYYSESDVVDQDLIRTRLKEYLDKEGWIVRSIQREEIGCLPIPLNPDQMGESSHVPTVGVRGGFYHAVTGYSLPSALRVASVLTQLTDLKSTSVDGALQALRKQWNVRDRFYCLLNRMLFRAAIPSQRYQVLRRFYQLRPELIARFYGGRWRVLDAIRILAGKPPVPVMRALKCLSGDPARGVA